MWHQQARCSGTDTNTVPAVAPPPVTESLACNSGLAPPADAGAAHRVYSGRNAGRRLRAGVWNRSWIGLSSYDLEQSVTSKIAMDAPATSPMRRMPDCIPPPPTLSAVNGLGDAFHNAMAPTCGMAKAGWPVIIPNGMDEARRPNPSRHCQALLRYFLRRPVQMLADLRYESGQW